MEPEQDPPLSPGLFMWLWARTAGVDLQTLRACPPHDWSVVEDVAKLMMCTMLYQAGIFSGIAHLLFAAPGQIRPDFVLVSVFLGVFIQRIDGFMIIRSGWYLGGLAELKRGGLDLGGGIKAHLHAWFFLLVRLMLSLTLAQLTAIGLSLMLFNPDISSKLYEAWKQANVRLFPVVTELVDNRIKSAREEEATQGARVKSLDAQVGAMRQGEIDPLANDPEMQQARQEVAQLVDAREKAENDLRSSQEFASNELGGMKGAHAGRGLRRSAGLEQARNAAERIRMISASLEAARRRLDEIRERLTNTGTARAGSDVKTFEALLKQERDKLATAQASLVELVNGRDEAIGTALSGMPGYVKPDTGLIARLKVLEQITREDSAIHWMVVTIMAASLGFELAAVIATSTSHVPTTYAALLVRNSYVRLVRLVEETVRELEPTDPTPEPPVPQPPANDNWRRLSPNPQPTPFDAANDPAPPKRPRGRPRKNPLN